MAQAQGCLITMAFMRRSQCCRFVLRRTESRRASVASHPDNDFLTIAMRWARSQGRLVLCARVWAVAEYGADLNRRRLPCAGKRGAERHGESPSLNRAIVS